VKRNKFLLLLITKIQTNMKKAILILSVLFFSVGTRAQENSLTLSGGYVFTNIEESDIDASGYRINALFDFNPQQGMFSHGFSMGFIHTTASNTTNAQTTDYRMINLPAYYAPRLTFGKQSFKVYIKGALGLHFSNYKRTASHTEITDWDAGFFGGAGLGVKKIFNEKMFVSLEYEWDYLSNTAYVDGFVNSAMLGVGIIF
jgi:hypothetical protein